MKSVLWEKGKSSQKPVKTISDGRRRKVAREKFWKKFNAKKMKDNPSAS